MGERGPCGSQRGVHWASRGGHWGSGSHWGRGVTGAMEGPGGVLGVTRVGGPWGVTGVVRGGQRCPPTRVGGDGTGTHSGEGPRYGEGAESGGGGTPSGHAPCHSRRQEGSGPDQRPVSRQRRWAGPSSISPAPQRTCTTAPRCRPRPVVNPPAGAGAGGQSPAGGGGIRGGGGTPRGPPTPPQPYCYPVGTPQPSCYSPDPSLGAL